MPVYQFQCNACGCITEKTIPRGEAGTAWCWCRHCGGYAFRIADRRLHDNPALGLRVLGSEQENKL